MWINLLLTPWKWWTDERTEEEKRNNKNRVTYFNPPYTLNVETNVGKIFLQLLDTHFPPGHMLRSVMNRNSVKISNRCLPNIGSYIAKHNSKILSQESNTKMRPPPSCNCQKTKKSKCPIPGKCNQKGVIYQATITSDNGKKPSIMLASPRNSNQDTVSINEA